MSVETQTTETGDSQEKGGLPELGECLRKEFLFSDNYHNLNNGSYGAVPKRVFEAQQKLMLEREINTEMWCRHRRLDMYRDASRKVAEFLGVKPENMVLVENATSATNAILKSFHFEDGDQILVSSHNYNAVQMTVKLVCNLQKNVTVVTVPIPLEPTYADIIDLYTRAIDDHPRIRLAIIDHITSWSALRLPVEELIGLCQGRGMMVAVDGAHCPGHLPLDIEKLGADFYIGNLHKWLFAARGCGIFYIHPKHHGWIRTTISSHNTFDEDLISRFHYVGTRDNIPYFVTPDAIEFHKDLGGLERITAHNTELVYWAADMMAEAFHTRVVEREPRLRAPFMCLVVLPNTPNLAKFATDKDLMHELVTKHNLGACITWQGRGQMYLRLGAHVYNYKEEYHMLRDALINILGIEKSTD